MGQCLFIPCGDVVPCPGIKSGTFLVGRKTTYLAVGRVTAVWLAALLPKQLDILFSVHKVKDPFGVSASGPMLY